MQIEMEPNPNSSESVQFVFNELEEPRSVIALQVGDEGKEIECRVIGVDEGGRWIPARAVKIADSSDGIAYLIYGGAWGIRLKSDSSAPWDLNDKRQWGEPFKVYGRQEDIIYAA